MPDDDALDRFMKATRDMADALLNVDRRQPDWAFIMMVAPVVAPIAAERQVRFVTNCQRDIAIAAVKEFLAQLEGRSHPPPDTVQ